MTTTAVAQGAVSSYLIPGASIWANEKFREAVRLTHSDSRVDSHLWAPAYAAAGFAGNFVLAPAYALKALGDFAFVSLNESFREGLEVLKSDALNSLKCLASAVGVFIAAAAVLYPAVLETVNPAVIAAVTAEETGETGETQTETTMTEPIDNQVELAAQVRALGMLARLTGVSSPGDLPRIIQALQARMSDAQQRFQELDDAVQAAGVRDQVDAEINRTSE